MKIYQTEQSGHYQCGAVGAGSSAPKGLGRDGYKPLMRNRERLVERLSDGTTAPHIFLTN